MFDEEARGAARPDAAAGGGRQRRRVAAELGAAARTCRRSTWRTRGGSTPRASATTSSTSASTRILQHAGAGELPVPVGQHRRDGDRRGSRTGSSRRAVFTVNGVRVGVIGATVREHARARRARATPRACAFLDEAERIKRESASCCAAGREGAGRGHPRGRRAGANAIGGTPGRGVGRARSSGIVERAAGHDGRPRDRRPHAPHRQHGRRPHPGGRGRQRRRQLLGRPADGRRTATSPGRARRRASPRTSASPSGPTCRRSSTRPTPRRRALRNQVIGTQAIDILRDPTRLNESAMGNLVADAMRAKYPGVEAAITNSGGLRAGPPARRRRRRRGSRARSRGARCSPCCRSATAR